VYRLYLAKVERKGRTQEELDAVICWFTGYSPTELAAHLDGGTTFADFFVEERLADAASGITGVVCGVRVEAVVEPRMRAVRRLDKLVEELARGRPLDRVIRS
jgi:hypothetical protein